MYNMLTKSPGYDAATQATVSFSDPLVSCVPGRSCGFDAAACAPPAAADPNCSCTWHSAGVSELNMRRLMMLCALTSDACSPTSSFDVLLPARTRWPLLVCAAATAVLPVYSQQPAVATQPAMSTQAAMLNPDGIVRGSIPCIILAMRLSTWSANFVRFLRQS
jgi:hypothetical protein